MFRLFFFVKILPSYVKHLVSWTNLFERINLSSLSSEFTRSASVLFVLIFKPVSFLSSRLLSKNLKIKIYKTIIFPFVLYDCEKWSLTLRKECRLRVFENRILRRIFGPKREENGEWRRLHNKEFHSLVRSPNIVRVIKSRRLRWAGHVARIEEGRSAF